ncbi:hypothetical protein NKH69_31595 [Mesorhizobium sp. M0976]|uniref:hypothetical protein n=1 Tax=Mesorhizobium sp. M0976 TaxID=2957038 RepID=UPI0033394CBE
MIDATSVEAVDNARVMLDQFKGKSETIAQAIDDSLLDFMTLLFVVEATRERFHNRRGGWRAGSGCYSPDALDLRDHAASDAFAAAKKAKSVRRQTEHSQAVFTQMNLIATAKFSCLVPSDDGKRGQLPCCCPPATNVPACPPSTASSTVVSYV